MAAPTLDGLTQKPMWMTHMGCLIGCAEFLKAEASPAWIYGGSGHAFALNIHEQLCPSGPTAWCAEKCDALAAHVGLQVEDCHGDKRHQDFAQEQDRIWQRTRAAIDAGIPCFGWELDVPEWYVVQGYDARGHYLFDKFGKPGRCHWKKLGDTGIGVATIRAVRRVQPADDRTVVREALHFAIEHGAGKHSHEAWTTGLGGYDAWMRALQDDEKLKGEVIGFGLAYNAQCWAECRRHALAFLEEAARRLDDKALAPLFDEAIARYRIVAERLADVARTFPFNVGDKAGMNARLREAPRREKAVAALETARAAEQAGLKALAALADALRPAQ